MKPFVIQMLIKGKEIHLFQKKEETTIRIGKIKKRPLVKLWKLRNKKHWLDIASFLIRPDCVYSWNAYIAPSTI